MHPRKRYHRGGTNTIPELELITDESVWEVYSDLIADAEKHAGISQRELAERLGVSPSTITRYRQRQRTIPFAMFVNTVRALGGEVKLTVSLPPERGDLLDVGKKLRPLRGSLRLVE